MKLFRTITVFLGFLFLSGCSNSSNLYDAILNNDKEQVIELIESGVDINTPRSKYTNNLINSIMDYENIYPLELACEKYPDIAYILLENGADVNVVDSYIGANPLIYTLSSNHPDRFNLALDLVRLGADVNHTDKNKRSAINLCVHTLSTDSIATREQSLELLKELLDLIDINDIITNSSSNPLSEAAKFGNCEAIEYLVNHNIVDINIKTDGMTPLMIAAINKNIDAYNLLIELGADTSIVSNEGKTAYDYINKTY